MWHSGRAGGAAGPSDWGWGARSRRRSRVTTGSARHWRRDAGEEEERQIKANLPPNPSRSPASSRKELALLWEALGSGSSNPC